MKTAEILILIFLISACTEKSSFKGDAKVVKPKPAATENIEESDGNGEAEPEPEEEAISEEKEETTIAASLDGARWDLPCDTEPSANQHSCRNTPGTVNKVVKVKGDSSTTYEVTLHIRGVVEPMTYSGGAQSSIDPHFYEGGVPNNPNFNIYRLSTSLPAQDYYLNSAASVGSVTFVIDYQITVLVKGQSEVTLFADNQNGDSISNFENHTVPGLETPPALLSGQYVQMDVVSVKAQ